MVSLSGSGVAWYSKNWVILNTQPEGSEPSNRGTTNFIWEWLSVYGFGIGMAEEDDGDGEW